MIKKENESRIVGLICFVFGVIVSAINKEFSIFAAAVIGLYLMLY